MNTALERLKPNRLWMTPMSIYGYGRSNTLSSHPVSKQGMRRIASWFRSWMLLQGAAVIATMFTPLLTHAEQGVAIAPSHALDNNSTQTQAPPPTFAAIWKKLLKYIKRDGGFISFEDLPSITGYTARNLVKINDHDSLVDLNNKGPGTLSMRLEVIENEAGESWNSSWMKVQGPTTVSNDKRSIFNVALVGGPLILNLQDAEGDLQELGFTSIGSVKYGLNRVEMFKMDGRPQVIYLFCEAPPNIEPIIDSVRVIGLSIPSSKRPGAQHISRGH